MIGHLCCRAPIINYPLMGILGHLCNYLPSRLGWGGGGGRLVREVCFLMPYPMGKIASQGPCKTRSHVEVRCCK